MPTERIRALLVDDHAMVRQGLRKYLNHCADMELIGEATDGEEAVHPLSRNRRIEQRS